MRLVRNLWILTLILLFSLPVVAQENLVTDATLPQLYVTGDGQTRFRFPADWVAQGALDNASAYVATSEAALNLSFGDQAVSGEVNVLAGTATLAYFNQQLGTTFDAAASAEELLQSLADAAAAGSPEFPDLFGEIETINHNDLAIAQMRYGVEDSFSGVAWLRQVETGVYALTQLTTTEADLSEWEAIGQAIFLSIEYQAGLPVPALTQEASSQNDQIRVSYPADWESSFESSDETTVVLANQSSALARTLGDEIQPGEVSIIIGGYSSAQMQEILGTDNEDILAGVGALLVEGAESFSSNDGWTIEEAVDVTVDDYPAIYVRTSGETFAASTWVFEREPGVFISMSLLTHPDEEADWLPTAIAIASQTSFTPAS
ncbi:MAG TPA: hypothetical protein PLQ56_01120 [Aggregatilineales bacterium]|nr:hypothetical protein [Aggregatilineales bacterium]